MNSLKSIAPPDSLMASRNLAFSRSLDSTPVSPTVPVSGSLDVDGIFSAVARYRYTANVSSPGRARQDFWLDTR
jgi:hypothetical protein